MTATLFDRRQTVRRQVELFRGTSRRLRELKRNSRGKLFNPSLRQIHVNQMVEIRNSLEAMGHKGIARMLTQWHVHLVSARLDGDAETRRQRVLLAREVSRDIARAIEEIR